MKYFGANNLKYLLNTLPKDYLTNYWILKKYLAHLRYTILWIYPGGYRDALTYKEGEPIDFNFDAFISSRQSTMQPFLQMLLHQQAFEQFITERLQLLNSRRGFTGLFEVEADKFADKSSQSKQLYKQWIKVI